MELLVTVPLSVGDYCRSESTIASYNSEPRQPGNSHEGLKSLSLRSLGCTFVSLSLKIHFLWSGKREREMRSNRRNPRRGEEQPRARSPDMEVAGHSMLQVPIGSPMSALSSVDVHRELVETDAVARDVEAELRFQ
eukprot:400944-Rhodomonas_salina.2